MITGHLILPLKDKTFNLRHYVFNHLFTIFLNSTTNNSLSTYSNSLFKVAFNLSKDEGSRPSHCKTLMPKTLGIKVLTTSSHAFFPTHHLSTSPPLPRFYSNIVGFFTSSLSSLAYYIIFFLHNSPSCFNYSLI